MKRKGKIAKNRVMAQIAQKGQIVIFLLQNMSSVYTNTLIFKFWCYMDNGEVVGIFL